MGAEDDVLVVGAQEVARVAVRNLGDRGGGTGDLRSDGGDRGQQRGGKSTMMTMMVVLYASSSRMKFQHAFTCYLIDAFSFLTFFYMNEWSLSTRTPFCFHTPISLSPPYRSI